MSEPVAPFAATGAPLEAGLLEAVVNAARSLESDSLCVLRRKPLVDEDCPEVSDVDLVLIWDRPDERPERVTVQSSIGRVFVDILWIPASGLIDPVEAAGYRMLPHLLAESELVSARVGAIGSIVEAIKLNMYQKPVWERRIGEQLNFGDAALNEASRNMDFPPAAIFYLQAAHAYYMTALADCLKRSVMSLLTRPMTKLARMSSETGLGLEEALRANLNLGAEPSASLKALRRVHDAVVARSSPEGLKRLSERTRGHYLYSISPLELEYREAVASALVRRGDFSNANFYLRFWAYSLSRCPVILEDGRQGRETSFYVPFRPFNESIQASCPEILDDMRTILGADSNSGDARAAVVGTEKFRGLVADLIRARGLSPASSWEASAALNTTTLPRR